MGIPDAVSRAATAAMDSTMPATHEHAIPIPRASWRINAAAGSISSLATAEYRITR